ncbi:MAG: hypothetical protein JRI54_11445 [Deltaproteobacteria bacterium]|nr:hypothetical protein [Deltaproteobacteria bacterium]
MDTKQMRDRAQEQLQNRRCMVYFTWIDLIVIGLLAVLPMSSDKFRFGENDRDPLQIVFLIIILGSFIYLVLVYMPGISIINRLFKLPRLFCPECDRYIPDDSPWICPYCDYRNSAIDFTSATLTTIYSPCKQCSRQAGYIQCPQCSYLIQIDDRVSDDKAVELAKPFLETVIKATSELVTQDIDPGDLVTEVRDLFAVVSGKVDKDDLDIMRLQKERQKLEELKKIQELKATSKPEADLTAYERKLREELLKKELILKYRKREAYLNLMSERQTRQEIENLFQQWEDELLAGRNPEDLPEQERRQWEYLVDWKVRELSQL